MMRIAWEYGKLGLLIDDQPDAAARVARELYGAEALPAWWKVARSMECACEALAAFLAVLTREDLKELRGLVILDRYLPDICGPGGRSIPWDDQDDSSKLRKSLEQLVGDLLEAAESARPESARWKASRSAGSNFDMKFITSYPYVRVRQWEAEAASAGLRIPWKIRSIELLHQYRQEINQKNPKDPWKRLLHYGPEPDAPVVGRQPPEGLFPDQQRLEASRWRARIWWPCIKKLASFLRQRANDGAVPVVLLTGAGASLAQGPHSPGMPSTWELLKFACRKVEDEAHEPDRRWPPLSPASCLCDGAETLQKPGETWNGTESPVTWLLERHRRGIKELDWRLENLFNPKHHRKNQDQFQKFHRAFHDALYTCDHGYPYHHWLIARMPWSAIVTTNFDGFHERAAAAAAQISSAEKERSRSLRLGSPVPTGPQVSRERIAETLLQAVQDLVSETSQEALRSLRGELRAHEEARQEAALFKPYGSLYSPGGEVALSPDEIKFFSGRFRESLQGALQGVKDGEGGALVVIGHSMRDNFIADVIKEMEEKLQDFQLLWVDPGSYSRSLGASKVQELEGGIWEALVDRKREQSIKTLDQVPAQGVSWLDERTRASDLSGPLPATALEFLYDLWMTYQEK
ncbi:MAG TPA: SIR2 family protein [Thermoanaerobaculia bacterium]|nr:SIR2 family protein [Thermoanaerobaculia bacterium]